MNDTATRQELVLQTADSLFGAITMGVVLALFPAVTPANLRRVMADLVAHGALVPAWVAGTGQRVWLTARSAEGHVSGLRKWVVDPATRARSLAAKSAGTVQPPNWFEHAQLAGQIVAAYGECGREFDSELHDGGSGPVADGVARPEQDWRLLIEVERMVRQSVGRWQRTGGLIGKITAELGQTDAAGALVQHLVVAPKHGGGRSGIGVDFESELERLVRAKSAELAGVPRDAGLWFLPIEQIESDPVWHPIYAGTEAPRSLPGIASRRAAFGAMHADNAAIDRARKARARAAAAGVRLPAGVTVLSASAGRPVGVPPAV